MPPQKENATEMNSSTEEKESCRSCLYTGVGTCLGLSAYFFHLAFEDDDSSSKKAASSNNKPCQSRGTSSSFNKTGNSTNTSMKNFGMHNNYLNSLLRTPLSGQTPRLFLLVCSTCCAVAGAYRLYLN
jgi:hypothetical protein